MSSYQRLYDAFLICSLDASVGLEENHLMRDYNSKCTPLHQYYKSNVLACFPGNSVTSLNKEAVNMMCMPHGVQLATAKRVPPPSFHSFIVTREDGSKIYGSAATFFELVTDQAVLAALVALQSIHVAELSNSIVHPTQSSDAVTKSLPRHLKLGTKLTQSEISKGYLDPSKDKLLVSKCLVLTSELPIVYASKRILFDLIAYVSSNEKMPFSIESVIYNFLYRIPLPLPGQTVAFRTCKEEPVIVTRPGEYELPLLDYSLKEFFLVMPTEKIVLLLSCVLLEQQILLQSTDCQKLILVSECVTSLLAPFSWPHVYVPVLPASMDHFLDAPVPFVMGLVMTTAEKPQINQSNLCIVDLNTGRFDVPEDVPPFPNSADLVEDLLGICRQYGVGISSNPSSTESGSSSAAASQVRQISWGSDSGISGDESSASRQNVSEVLQNSEAFQTVSELARKAGVPVSLSEIEQGLRLAHFNYSRTRKSVGNAQLDKYIDDMHFNNEIRESILNRFAVIFGAYENFVVQTNQDKETWLNSRESSHNFDKTAFLSDQPRQHLPFLSRFIESQMFTTFIDQKILQGFGEHHSLVQLFDQRVQKYKCHHRDSVVRMTTYDLQSAVKDSEKSLEKRIATIDLIVPQITEVLSEDALRDSLAAGKLENIVGISFPQLNGKILNKEPHRKRKSGGRRRAACTMEEGSKSETVSFSRSEAVEVPNEFQLQQPSAANWNFVQQLLKEVKVKTTRMLVAKLGAEAADLGHADVSLVGVEENTMIASLCDLIERIWSHGLQVKQGKSSLWSHLLHYQDLYGYEDEPKALNPNSLSPDMSTNDVSPGSKTSGRVSSTPASPTHTLNRKHISRSRNVYRSEGPSPLNKSNNGSLCHSPTRYSRKSSPERGGMQPLPDTLAYDIRNIRNMADIKSQIGYARAFVRLCLEKKVLSCHIQSLFSETNLIGDLYKRHAFLRSDDEREQFLYHLLSLNTVEYYCFTHAFTNTVISYRILIVPSRKFNASTTSANVWIRLSGTLGVSTELAVPKGQLEFLFKHKNLGLLTTITIGHDNSGLTPRWLVDYMVARNELTGHTYRFQCGRWLGVGVDDDSLERLLVAERIDSYSKEESCQDSHTRSRSSSLGPRGSGSTTNLMNSSFSGSLPRWPEGQKNRTSIAEIQDSLGHSVNSIVKYYCKHEPDGICPSAFTPLLCGDQGLVHSLEQIFSFGIKSPRFFGRKLYIWDYLVKFREHYLSRLNSAIASTPSGSRLALIDMIGKIEANGIALGKDGKFQVFVCLAFRENQLCNFIKTLSSSSVTVTLYEESSFLRDKRLLSYLSTILGPLCELKVILEPSLFRGLSE
ncbi:DENN domain-containing protein 5B-like isoform X2 [Artemia franciscana]|uniref:DENN domain-containing protein 5B-like isoform X2 n=1 Tax=Artemia franciscana TaxID=6661 RepID=UPI0032DBCEAA